jgi:hypothetical protein
VTCTSLLGSTLSGCSPVAVLFMDTKKGGHHAVGKSDAPVVAVLLGSPNAKARQTTPSLPPKGANRCPSSHFPANRLLLKGPRRGQKRPWLPRRWAAFT